MINGTSLKHSIRHVSGFYVSQRVQLHPATDAWMSGDRYGDVVKLGKKYAHVLMDRSGRTLKVAFELVMPLCGTC